MANAPGQNSRYCGAPLGTPKGYSPDYCRNIVQFGTPKCAAGHDVPKIGATPVARMVNVGSNAKVTPPAPPVEVNEESFPTTIDFSEIEQFLASGSSSLSEGAVHEPSVAEMEMALEADDSARASELHEQFTQFFGLKPEFMKYTGTARGERQRLSGGTAPYQLDRFILGADEETVLAFGDYGEPHSIYLESCCSSENCENKAYTRFYILQIIPEERASEQMALAARQASLSMMLGDAQARADKACCDKHRQPSDSMHGDI